MKRVVSFSIETDLVKRLEDVSWDMHKSRSELVEGFLRKGLTANIEKQVISDEKSDDEILAEAQERLNRIRAQESSQEQDIFFNPQPKGGVT